MTLWGNTLSAGSLIASYPHLYDRSGDYAIERYEAYVRASAPDLPSFVVRAHRGSYFSSGGFGAAWPENTSEARWQRDATAGRMIFFSAKASGSLTWAQVASGAMDGNIDARGLQLLAFILANPGITLCFTFHHEPNNGGEAAQANISGSSNETQGITNWWAAMERICTRWDALGIPRAVVTQAGQILSPGMIYAGPNIAGAAQVSNTAVYQAWWRTPATLPWAYGPNGVTMACFDMYQGSASGGGTWRAFNEMAGATSSRPGFVLFMQPLVAQQNAAGRPLLLAIWEFGCDEFNKMWPNASTRMFDTTPSTYWTNQVGLAPSMPNWFDHAGSYITANPHLFFAVIFWDSTASSGGSPSGRGPHMIDAGAPTLPNQSATPGTQQATWEAHLRFVRACESTIIAPPPPPPPPPSDPLHVPGVITHHQRVRIGA